MGLAPVIALLAALLAQPYVPGVGNPTEFIIDELPIATGESKGDWFAKRFWELQKDRRCVRDGNGGCIVRLRCGTEYTTEVPIVSCRSMWIQGCAGGAARNGTTRIRQVNPRARSLLKYAFAHECRTATSAGGYGMPGGDGSWTVVEGVELAGAGINQIDHVRSPQFGIEAQGIPILRDVYIHDFTVNLLLVAAAKNPAGFPTNVNRALLDNVVALTSAGPSIYVDGPDSNASLFSHVNVMYACQRASPELLAALGISTCAGIIDSSYLGNVYLNPHVSDSFYSLPRMLSAETRSGAVFDQKTPSGGDERLVRFEVPAGHGFGVGYFGATVGFSCLDDGRNRWTAEVTPTSITIRDVLRDCPLGPLTDGVGTLTAIRQYFPAYVLDPAQRVAHNLVLGAYAEEDQLRSIHNQASMVVGGLSPWRGDGTRIQQGIANRFSIINAKSLGAIGRVDLGENCNLPGCVFQVDPTPAFGGGLPHRLVVDPIAKTLRSNVAVSVQQWEIGLSKDSPLGLGGLRVPSAVRSGSSRWVLTGTAAP